MRLTTSSLPHQISLLPATLPPSPPKKKTMRYPYYNRIFRARPLFHLLRLFFITATSTILILVLSYEPHIELAFYPRKWISSQILTLAPLSECFNPDNMQGTGYNVTKHLHGPKRNTVNPGIQMRFGMDCYDYAGTVQARWEDRPKPRREGEVLPGEERVQFHTYWRTDLAPFGERQEYMLKSFFATQNLESSRLVLWSNGDLSSSPLLRGYLKRYPEAFTLRIVNIPRLARGTKLEESDRLGTKDERAWVDGDLIRLLLLWNYGGVWVDMDSLLTRDLDPLLEHEFVTQWDCYGVFVVSLVFFSVLFILVVALLLLLVVICVGVVVPPAHCSLPSFSHHLNDVVDGVIAHPYRKMQLRVLSHCLDALLTTFVVFPPFFEQMY